MVYSKSLISFRKSAALNPIEGIWNIIKQHLRRGLFNSEEEMKEVLQEGWGKITLKEIQERISIMLLRCSRLAKTGGRPIKGLKW
ncbi:uncharacterized protein K444DRAFT_528515 [Hyaloscypha bicolor E]|uniref:Tc1-like transposase DDE domain-containing protein n=1 Tax=Hyaloscypha bicolor E TaxID=1095630 RepID=A0A2J6TBA9_9HELO|nr:uncharacterized protein K444DRAFT_528515 [Hyaloscypha bicolor E]PMD60320.1 hypothetical protein K444DRAFT_528515 [Hyaloscypha bicolor E]